MVSLDNYHAKVVVSISASTFLANKINRLFGQVILKLPDEEQFGLSGMILIGPRELAVNFYRKITSDTKFGLGSSINLYIGNGNYALWFRGNLTDSEFLITIIIDDLDEKSDDYIKGLIAYKLSELSYGWKTISNAPPEELMNMLDQTGMNSPFGSEERENYERNVDEEARRLGFSEELLAYDLG